MSKEELYTLTLSDIHKYKLLNEIFAIRDERFSKEQQDSMLCVNGYIGIDTLNDYVNLINQLQQKENIIKEVREYITSKKFEENFPYVANECQVRSAIIKILDKKEVN